MSSLDKPAMPQHYAKAYNEDQGGMTIRQHAAITLRVPMSGDPELDAMIREARLRDAAEQAIGAYIIAARLEGWAAPNEYQAKQASINAYMVADALLAASEPKKAEPEV